MFFLPLLGLVAGAVTSSAAAVTTTAGVIAATGTAAASAAGAVGASVAASGSALVGLGTAAAEAVGGAVGTALAASTEMAIAAAAESTVIVGQIPVVGETLAAAAKGAGAISGEIISKTASTLGMSSQTANTLGTMASAKTTHRINTEILRPYNEIKDEITGLSEIKGNLKVLDDIAQGRLSMEELTDLAINKLDLPELAEAKDTLQLLQEVQSGQYSLEELKEEALARAISPELKEAIKQVPSSEADIKKLLLDSLSLPDLEQAEALKKLALGSATREEAQELLLSLADAEATETIKDKVELLKALAEGKVDFAKLQSFILEYAEENTEQVNEELLDAVKSGNVSRAAMSVIVADILGVSANAEDVGKAENPLEGVMKGNDNILSSWLAEEQSGKYYDIFVPQQYLQNPNFVHLNLFFPGNIRACSTSTTYSLTEFEISHVGEPVVYALVNFLLDHDVEFRLAESFRNITINSLGREQIKLLKYYSELFSCNLEEAYGKLKELPCVLDKNYTVEETADIVAKLKLWGVEFKVDKVGAEPQFTYDFYLVASGEQEFSIIQFLMEKYGYSIDKAVEMLEKAKFKKQLLVADLSLEEGKELKTALAELGGYGLVCVKGEEELNETFLRAITPLDSQEAYTMAKAAGNTNANVALGEIYYNKQEYDKAISLYQEAAELDNPWGMNELGLCFEDGNGTSVNYEKALELYVKAAKMGYADAIMNYGSMFTNARVVGADYSKAISMYEKAQAKGSLSAIRWLGWHYREGKGVTLNYDKAVEYFEKAARYNHKNALSNMGYMYRYGYGKNKDIKKALEYFEKAAELGSANAYEWLGWLYYEGKEVSYDPTRAQGYYRKGAKLGSTYCKEQYYKNWGIRL